MIRSLDFTYINGNTPFFFQGDKMTRHPFKAKGATMLQTHALLTIDGREAGRPVDLLDSQGNALSQEDLKECSRTGEVPSHWAE